MQESSEDAVQNNHPANSVQSSSTEVLNDTHEDPTHSPPEWGSTWLSQTASAKGRTNEKKAIPDKTTTAKAETENVVAESVSAQHVSAEKAVGEKAAEEKVAIAKRTQTRRRCSRMYQGTLDHQRLEEEQRYAGFLGDVS